MYALLLVFQVERTLTPAAASSNAGPVLEKHGATSLALTAATAITAA